MTADDVLDYAEPLLACRRKLARMAELAAFGKWEAARDYVALAADHLLELELALNQLEARERMRHEKKLLNGRFALS